MNTNSGPNYWIFQAHPRQLRLQAALRAELLQTFAVNAHRKRIREGDKVILWLSGKARACYALCTVRTTPKIMEVGKAEASFYLKAPKKGHRVMVQIDYNLWNQPIPPNLLPAHLNIPKSRSGTNYEATAELYRELEGLIQQQEAVNEPTERYLEAWTGSHPLNLILYGPPGTGKTYNTLNHALAIIEGRSLGELELEDRSRLRKRYEALQKKGQIAFLSFHQSYAYEDFVEGIKARTHKKQIVYEIEDGLFKGLCKKAAAHPKQRYVLIIDEINRGNIANIFGELITLIENDKRSGQAEAIKLQLSYSKTSFSVPPNLYLIATLNTADRSVEALDVALRRRFTFREVAPRPSVIGKVAEQPVLAGIDLERLLRVINRRIEVLLSRDYCIGHSYFLKISTLDELRQLFIEKIIPLLQEYFYSDYARIGLILGRDFVEEQSRPPEGLFADFEHEYLNELVDKKLYRLQPVEELEAAAFIRIYTREYI